MKSIRRLRSRKSCEHLRQRGIYGDEINARRGRRAECLDCGQLLDRLPPQERR